MREEQWIGSAVLAVLLALGGAANAPLAGDGPPVRPSPSAAQAVVVRLSHLRDHLLAHPEARAQDAYKLLHQSVFGPAHLIPDRSAAARYLTEEWAAMGAALPGEEMIEPLADQPPLVRVNLRPYRDAGGDPGALVDALVATANEVQGDPATFAACLEGAADLLREVRGEGLAADLRELAAKAAAEGYPALHHSPEYEQTYRPAYRVALRPLLSLP